MDGVRPQPAPAVAPPVLPAAAGRPGRHPVVRRGAADRARLVRAVLPRAAARRRARSRPCWPSPCCRSRSSGRSSAWSSTAGRAARSWSSVDLSRSVLALGLAALVATGLRTPGIETLFYGGVLLAMSLNRFLLAALSASLPHTIDADEYMVANSVVPTVGPAGVLVGVGVGTGLRLVLGQSMPDYQANAILFVVAAAGFVLSASLALRIPRRQLGPDDVDPPRPATSSPAWSRRLRHLQRAARRRPRAADHRRAPDHLRHRHRGDDPGLPQLLPHARPGRRGHRRPRSAGGGHRRRVRLRRGGDPAGQRPARAAELDHRLPGRLGGLPGAARRDLRQGAADGRRVPARPDRAEHQDLRRHPGPGPRGRRAQGPGLRALRHGLQRRSGAGRGDRRADPAGRRQVGADPGRAGRRLSAGRRLVRAGQPRDRA